MYCNLWFKVIIIGLSLTVIQGSNLTVASKLRDAQEASESDQKHVTMISFHQPKSFVGSNSNSKRDSELASSSRLNASQITNRYEVEGNDFDEPLPDQAEKETYSPPNHFSFSNKPKSLMFDNDQIMLEPKSLQGYSKNVLPEFKPPISKSEMSKLIDFVENQTPPVDSTYPSPTHHSNHFSDQDQTHQHSPQHFTQPDDLQQHFSQPDYSQPEQQDQPLYIQPHLPQQEQQQQPPPPPQYYSAQSHSSQQHSPEFNSLQIPPPPPPPPPSSLAPSHTSDNIHQIDSIMPDSESIENVDDDMFLNQDNPLHELIEPNVYGDSNEYVPEMLNSRLIGYDSMVPAPEYTPVVYETPSLFSKIMSALFSPYTRSFNPFRLQPMSFSLSQRANPMMPYNFNPIFFSPMMLKRQCRFNCDYGFLKTLSQIFRFRYKHWLSFI